MRSLGSRSAFNAQTSSGYDVQDYVGWGTSDLIAFWDGIRNVGATSPHNSSSTTWVDLTGHGYDVSRNYNAYTTGTFTDNALQCGGNRCAAFGYGKTIPDLSNTDGTFDYSVSYSRNIVNGDSWFIFAGGGSKYYQTVYKTVAMNIVAIGCASAYSRCGAIVSFPYLHYRNSVKWGSYTLPAKMHVSTSMNKSVINGYVLPSNGDTRNFSTSQWGRYMSFGTNLTGNSTQPTSSNAQLPAPFGFKFHSFRIYKRALTDAERERNYLIDKVRFGIS